MIKVFWAFQFNERVRLVLMSINKDKFLKIIYKEKPISLRQVSDKEAENLLKGK